MNFIKLHIRSFWLVLLTLSIVANICAQQNTQSEQSHELTLFAIPTLYPLNWENPSELYKSMFSCYIKTITTSHNYLLGHLAVQLKTPLLPQTLLLAMTSAKPSEKVDLVFKDKVGFAVLGAAIHGRIETQKELERNLEIYKKRNKLAFITYKVNETAMKRILRFIAEYSSPTNDKPAPCNYYGGAFWPIYCNEGSGCSAFGMALLDVAGLLSDYTNNWLVNVNIPMDLIGGPFNENKKIKNLTIKNTTSWHKGDGVENKNFVRYQIYEPSILFNWILQKRIQKDSIFVAIENDGLPGLFIDCENINVSKEKPIFKERPETNIFIDKYFENIKETK